MLKKLLVPALLVLGFVSTLVPSAQAQGYPNKSIRLIVPFPPGGGNDVIGRIIAQKLTERLGQQVVVDNRAGANGIVGLQALMQAPPDGYTIGVAAAGPMAVNPSLYDKLPYDPIKDFTAVGMIGTAPNVLCVNPGVPANDVKSFIEYVKSRPGKIAYGSAGAGSLTHLVGELFKQQTGLFMIHIPYRGVAPANVDLISGQTQALFPSLAGALPHIRSGRMRPLAVTGPRRHELLKDVPTFDELGYKGFDGQQWYGIVGPAGMPPAVVKTLSDALSQVLAQQDFKDKLSSEAVALLPLSPDAFTAYVKADIERWSKLAKERKIELES